MTFYTHNLDVPCWDSSPKRATRDVWCWCENQVLKATSPWKLLAGEPCGGNSEGPAMREQSNGLSEDVPKISGIHMVLFILISPLCL